MSEDVEVVVLQEMAEMVKDIVGLRGRLCYLEGRLKSLKANHQRKGSK